MNELPPVIIEKTISEEKPLMGRPNCPYPKTTTLKPQETKKVDGWITLCNQTDSTLKIKIVFTLPHGYHLEILYQDQEYRFLKSLTLGSSYLLVDNENSLECLSVENN